MFVLFVLGAMFWLETLLATSLRHRHRSGIVAGEGAGDPYREASDIRDPLVLTLPSLEACTFFSVALAIIGLLAFILLYTVK